jgi:UDP-3-O-[3-hydroxymyristoyl] glucosamine N-acyltransferase
MLIEHRGAAPDVHPSAFVAPTAVLCGAVLVGPEARILFGAVLTAEDGEIQVGAHCVIMENAVLRGRARHPLVVGDDVLIGPHAHLNGTRAAGGSGAADPSGPCGTGLTLGPGAAGGARSRVLKTRKRVAGKTV